ncbi:alpha/beta hydrolase [Alloacidobacterium sp.]|uniref:alpha/beta hydrolase n=1 Tax=Alloacidobacterium sp. TaxID=2951999 RepID=UPI002D2375A3|nr:alpha/beta hydrolase [Alloacidobacterium sp.]HYK36013.1 alpha/beta hydrolase [Alloacidobacterium sp.]
MSKHLRAHSEAHHAGWNDPLRPQKPLISGKWLLSAIAITLGMSATCAYATLCLLFYQGSWQFLFHPSHTVSVSPNIPYQNIQFDDTETGKPQLTGWWIPVDSTTRYSGNTILYLHDGRGSLSDSITQLDTLHTLGINVFVFDYRGFGRSADPHPSEISMNQDADAALAYLTGTRHLPTHSLILDGIGLGATIAVNTAARHSDIPALVLENISPDALTIFAADKRTKILPVRLLTSDRFDPTETLKTLQTPKLFIERANDPQTHYLFSVAAMPKQFFQIAPKDQTLYLETLQRFLDELPPHP